MLTKQMDYILELSKTLNFNRAAENLFISQPTLSYQIKTLEEELGFRIFDRRGKTVQLTPAGAQFTSTLQNIRNELQRAIEQGQNFSSKYKNSISIGMGVRSMLLYLPEAIVRFAETNPATDIVPYFQYYGMEESFLRMWAYMTMYGVIRNCAFISYIPAGSTCSPSCLIPLHRKDSSRKKIWKAAH